MATFTALIYIFDSFIHNIVVIVHLFRVHNLNHLLICALFL